MDEPQMVFDALGTTWWISARALLDEELKKTILQEVTRFASTYTRFRDDSVLGALNRDKLLKRPSTEMKSMIDYALQTYKDTGGVFNISVAAELEQAGYGLVGDERARVSTSLEKDVTISNESIRLANWVRLDFGGFGKGWLVDNIGGILRQQGVDSFVVNGGGDILCGDQPETLFIEHPSDETMAIGEIVVSHSALASSSNNKRTWKGAKGAQEAHIRKTTAHRQDQLLSVHVLAPTALIADTYATVMLLVDHPTRLRLARNVGFEFLEVRPDMRYWHTEHFGFDAYV